MIFNTRGHTRPSEPLTPQGWQIFIILFCILMLLGGISIIALTFFCESLKGAGLLRSTGWFFCINACIGFGLIKFVRHLLE
jgi:hypothetical protein